MEYSRREFLIRLISVASITGLDFGQAALNVFAMAATPIITGMREVKGDVRINGIPAKIGTPITVSDIITTGSGSLAVFVLEDHAFLIRENSRIELIGITKKIADKTLKVLKEIRMQAGKLLSVFGEGEFRIKTRTVVAGVRGTGIYVEAATDKTYVCTCYGEVYLQATASPDVTEDIETSHHEKPRFIYGPGAEKLIVKAPMQNHTDEELIMLESLVKREPPFMDTYRKSGYGY